MSGRDRQDEAARPAVAVEFGLDRIEDERDVLVLVHTGWASAGDERPGVPGHRVAHGHVVEVGNLRFDVGGEAPQQGGADTGFLGTWFEMNSNFTSVRSRRSSPLF
ncbi:hypothetical protein [Candidatus Protofrankia californiensis]|uniref:hypothetical protein n=1 Tax=Candidatus Protofrankia californiensis TaxID=1839754 RepID=UPI0013ED584A|nr:hypothetical protein [Candidatus Protofrankia californiensis]